MQTWYFFKVREWKDKGQVNGMCTARPGWATMSFRQGLYKKALQNIEINLVDILEVNSEKMVCYFDFIEAK